MQHDHAIGGVEEHRLVVEQQVRTGALFIEEEAAARVLERGAARDFAGDEDAVQHFRGLASPADILAIITECRTSVLR
jgi:hypothetical protein